MRQGGPVFAQIPVDPLHTARFGMSFIGFDFNVLGSYYASGASLSASVQTAVLRNGEIGRLIAAREQTVIPPWQQPEPVPDKSLEQRVFSQAALIDPNDPLFDRVDLDDDSKTLFAAYKALGEMLDIVNPFWIYQQMQISRASPFWIWIN